MQCHEIWLSLLTCWRFAREALFSNVRWVLIRKLWYGKTQEYADCKFTSTVIILPHCQTQTTLWQLLGELLYGDLFLFWGLCSKNNFHKVFWRCVCVCVLKVQKQWKYKITDTARTHYQGYSYNAQCTELKIENRRKKLPLIPFITVFNKTLIIAVAFKKIF